MSCAFAERSALALWLCRPPMGALLFRRIFFQPCGYRRAPTCRAKLVTNRARAQPEFARSERLVKLHQLSGPWRGSKKWRWKFYHAGADRHADSSYGLANSNFRFYFCPSNIHARTKRIFHFNCCASRRACHIQPLMRKRGNLSVVVWLDSAE